MFNKPLILILLSSLALNVLFGYMSYAFYGQKQVIKEKLIQCEGHTLSLKASLEREKKLCLIQDALVTEWTKEEQQAEKDTQESLSKIDRMLIAPAIRNNISSSVEEHNEKDSTIDLDSKLPDSLVRMLSEDCLRAKGSSCSNP